MNNSVISVILPVYNCSDFVSNSVNSILNQTFEDFELLIIDDASTDNTYEIVGALDDPRIRIIKKPENTGYTNSLNMGIEMANGKYIARMDGDDFSYPQRFQKQIQFFNSNPDAIVCGTNYKFMNSHEVNNHPSSPEEVRVHLLAGCYVAHPTVMFKKEVLLKNNLRYNPEFEPAEDYNLWVEMSRYGQIGNIPEVLLDYRTHINQVSQKFSGRQQRYTDHARLKMVSYLVPEMTKEQKSIHLSLVNPFASKRPEIWKMKKWVSSLKNANVEKGVFEQKILEDFLDQKLGEYISARKKIFKPLWERGMIKVRKELGKILRMG